MSAAADLLSVSEDVSGASISGVVAAGFEDVLQVFTENFRRRGEVGAACAIYRGDEMLVHLWGGYRDQARTERWNDDTLACVHSTTKAITAVAMAMAVSRGHFSLDDTVVSHWPEFGVHGKQHITIGQILDHSAGLPVVAETLTIEHLADLDGLSEILARQKPQWEPGTRHGYHGWTFGMYANEIMRRTDPEGRSVGQFVAKEISESLGEEFYIGLPDTVPDHRLSEEFTNLRTLLDMLTNKPVSTMGTMLRFLFERDTLQAKMLKNPVELGQFDQFNTRAVRRVEIPAGNGHGTARAMAHIMGACASGGASLGLSGESLAQWESRHPGTGKDEIEAVMGARVLFQAGMMKPNSEHRTLLGRPRCYFHYGSGGHIAFADPDSGLGLGYCNNRILAAVGDRRSNLLVDAMLGCVD